MGALAALAYVHVDPLVATPDPASNFDPARSPDPSCHPTCLKAAATPDASVMRPPSREPSAGACRGCALCIAPPAALALLLVLAATRGASAARCYASLSAADFPHCSLLSPSFALHWAVRGGNVTLGMDADTGGGWIGGRAAGS
ncbi:hypothetical protein TSOC_009507 [Tetrabaena socialis]|uniref:Uncharacterized protein n=1 Tax=Tetrabaena socialis TaxID=47790 RepID=A0A2J7ZVN5_9CHLO|nr:hypothetical protein TSOC_009507 [Tetrabaena socialis]|eukprot:PNH04332.1 hypothetical protein TSOC_009507 [Tetrabaena socialis]